MIDPQFLAITWSDHVWGIVESPWGSGVLLLPLTTGVIMSGAFFQRRTFCRSLSLLGGLCSNFSRSSVVELRADPAICSNCKAKAACYNGTPTNPAVRCSTFRTLDSSADCTLSASLVGWWTSPSSPITRRDRS